MGLLRYVYGLFAANQLSTSLTLCMVIGYILKLVGWWGYVTQVYLSILYIHI